MLVAHVYRNFIVLYSFSVRSSVLPSHSLHSPCSYLVLPVLYVFCSLLLFSILFILLIHLWFSLSTPLLSHSLRSPCSCLVHPVIYFLPILLVLCSLPSCPFHALLMQLLSSLSSMSSGYILGAWDCVPSVYQDNRTMSR